MGSYNPDIAIAQIANDPRIAGRLIRAGDYQASSAGATTYTAGAVGNAVYIPIDFGAGGRIDSMSINCTTLGATSQYRVALYARNATTGRPGQLVQDMGALDVTATGVKTSVAAAVAVSGLMYVLASPQGSNVAVVSGAATGHAAASALTHLIAETTLNASFFTANCVGYTETGVTAAPPATATPVLGTGAVPIVVWRWTAVAQS